MLFTRCPDCDTTFRVTDDALRKANGQVRCGRCASVFNAYAERREEPAEAVPDAPPQPVAAGPPAKPAQTDIGARQVAGETKPSAAPAPQSAPPLAGGRPEPPAPNPPIRRPRRAGCGRRSTALPLLTIQPADEDGDGPGVVAEPVGGPRQNP